MTRVVVELHGMAPDQRLGVSLLGGAGSPDGERVMVTGVTADSVAARGARIRPRDELLSVNGEPVAGRTHEEVVRSIERARQTGHVVLHLQRATTGAAEAAAEKRTSLRTRMRVRYPSLPFYAQTFFDWHATDADQLDLQVASYTWKEDEEERKKEMGRKERRKGAREVMVQPKRAQS